MSQATGTVASRFDVVHAWYLQSPRIELMLDCPAGDRQVVERRRAVTYQTRRSLHAAV